MLNIVIDKKSRVPMYIQVKRQIMELIRNGQIRVGSKMPTERMLAETLNLSRNTISSAYKELETEGVIKSFQGRGTFVIEEALRWEDKDVNNKISKFIDMALEEALAMGINIDEFLHIVNERVKYKKEAMKKLIAVYIECNIEQAKMFSKQLAKETQLNVVPLTLNDLYEMKDETREHLNRAKVIISTFNHINEVSVLTKDLDKEIFGVAIIPDISTLVRIARYPIETKFAFISISEEFLYKIKGALEKSGLENINIMYTNSKRQEEIKAIIEESDVIIVSPGRHDEVEQLNAKGKEIIKFIYRLDDGSVKNLKSKMVEIED